MKDVNPNSPTLITLNFLATKEELEKFGRGLQEVCDSYGFKFEPQNKILSPNGHPVYKIVKVRILGEQSGESRSESNGTTPTGEPRTEAGSEKLTEFYKEAK